MKEMFAMFLLMFALCEIASSQSTQNRSSIKCAEDSPERRGEEGCTILASRPIVGSMKGQVFWHIDRFNSLEDAKKAAGPNSVAAEAHGGVWLMTAEDKTKTHHGGRHVAWIGPLVLPAAEGYTMRVASSLLKQGASTPVHTHSGPEAWYIVVGEQCLETEKSAHRLKAGKYFVLPADQIHRGRVQSAEMRGALALVLHDSKRPASHDLTDPPPLVQCK
jgi:quercetin dioxygenase-like cupin family protein